MGGVWSGWQDGPSTSSHPIRRWTIRSLDGEQGGWLRAGGENVAVRSSISHARAGWGLQMDPRMRSYWSRGWVPNHAHAHSNTNGHTTADRGRGEERRWAKAWLPAGDLQNREGILYTHLIHDRHHLSSRRTRMREVMGTLA